MTPAEFARKWGESTQKERSAAQEHFIDICRMLGVPTPNEADPTGTWYAFERGAGKTDGADGFAAVKAEQGSTPSYSTYAQWESGQVGAREESLAAIRRFHDSRQAAPLDPAPDLAAALMALAAELAAAREERAAMRAEVDPLSAVVDRLVAGALAPAAIPAPSAPAAPGG